MLDVHPPHASPHTWRDFFIHIATIVVGLLIALGLEQSVEAIHRHNERIRLIEDLKQEARARVLEIRENNRSYLVLNQWMRDTLSVALKATPAHGYVVFTFPAPISQTSGNLRPSNAVWTAAKSAGSVSVLTREEIEDWERVDYFAQLAQRDTEVSQTALKSVEAVCDHLGIVFTASSTVRTTLAGRDELTRGLAVVIESVQSMRHDNEETITATETVLHGEQTASASPGSPDHKQAP